MVASTPGLHPVILSGGAGSRLWPLSRAALPKQLLPLVSEHTLFQEAVRRASALPGVAEPLVICNEEHRFMIAEQLRALGQAPSAIVLEPAGRNTAPAVAVAALDVMRRDPDGLLLVLPADHLITDQEAFTAVVAQAVRLAREGWLVTFGITPDRPETGYGYIRRGMALDDSGGAYQIAAFVEKPAASTAAIFLGSGDYLWNSGVFLCRARDVLAELGTYRADILAACETAIAGAVCDLDFVRLDPVAFGACPFESIDSALMELTRKAVVVPAAIGWNDIGAWDALWAVGEKDAAGNVCRGDVLLEAASNNLVRAESRLVALLGVDGLVVVETPDALLVARRDCVQDVKRIVERLKHGARGEHLSHSRVYRPWGWYEEIDAGDRFQVKRIMVKPREKLSLQLHHHRAEHWIVVSGTARVVRGDDEIMLTENQSTYIPLGSKHRLENPGKIPLHLIEVQSGAYLGEDDIVRYEDVYKRI